MGQNDVVHLSHYVNFGPSADQTSFQMIQQTGSYTSVLFQDIDVGDELLTWFQPRKRKKRKQSTRNSIGTST